jgi:hypothetical protein
MMHVLRVDQRRADQIRMPLADRQRDYGGSVACSTGRQRIVDDDHAARRRDFLNSRWG